VFFCPQVRGAHLAFGFDFSCVLMEGDLCGSRLAVFVTHYGLSCEQRRLSASSEDCLLRVRAAFALLHVHIAAQRHLRPCASGIELRITVGGGGGLRWTVLQFALSLHIPHGQQVFGLPGRCKIHCQLIRTQFGLRRCRVVPFHGSVIQSFRMLHWVWFPRLPSRKTHLQGSRHQLPSRSCLGVALVHVNIPAQRPQLRLVDTRPHLESSTVRLQRARAGGTLPAVRHDFWCLIQPPRLSQQCLRAVLFVQHNR